MPCGKPFMESVCGWCFKCHRGWCRIIIITSEGIRLEHLFRLGFKAFNNEAEYEALIVGLRTDFDLGAHDVEVYSDSRPVVNQVRATSKHETLG